MDEPSNAGLDEYDWQPCSLIFPRIGKLMNRQGVHTRLLLPGSYFVRRSRSRGDRIYRVAR
ncbi:hypothetical protein [Sphingopyxis indica]|uniref:hypothetical protein n=1 Tax=Sphingopyxis indica TaxID=436663 RepID=UPI001130B77D|nr:hypothetical protein [Sphingopyxis indica]WOF42196.1 hypothetical protein KNJ79_13370 [Sphingopyxis indica]